MTTREFLLACLLPVAACQANPEPELARRHESARVLRSERLHVEVMDPAAPAPYNRGNRFSPVANVLRVALDGRDFLYSPIEHNPLADNAGLAMEFDLRQSARGGPPGFAEAAEGAPFLKVGVGVLRKTGDEYAFYKPYETIALAPVAAEWGSDHASFRQECASPELDLAYALEAEVLVHGRVVEIDYRLKNTGKKAFATEQYAHNFFAFDGAGMIGPGYELEFSGAFSLEEIKSRILRVDGLRVGFGEGIAPRKAINAMAVLEPVPGAGSETVTVRHPASGLEVRATVSIPTVQVALHAAPRYLCAEQFVRLTLRPGEEATWRRSYEFIENEGVER